MAVNEENRRVRPGDSGPRERPCNVPQNPPFGNDILAHYLPSGHAMSDASPPAVYYQCQRCANCCRWPGFVRLDDGDITAIAAHLGLSEHDFIQRFTRLRPQRDGLALIDQPGGACVFLDGGDCRVQPVKPQQCRGFPNAWNFPGWREVCEAVPVKVVTD